MNEEEEFKKVEEEKVELMEERIKELEHYKTTHPHGGAFSKYVDTSTPVVNDPFSHASNLLASPKKDPTCYSDLFNPHILLGNIKDGKTLALFQRDYRLLMAMFSLGKRSPAMMDMFLREYNTWILQVRMTSAVGGAERIMQAFETPPETGTGFSFGSRKKSKQKKQGVKDYIVPQEEGIYD